jgi:AcrR family transcriptional regulator
MRSDASRNHEAILSAAIAVLAETPDATMQEIADASAIGRTTLYRHFPDRAALVDAIYDRVVSEAEQITVARLDADPDPDPDDDPDPVAVLAGLAAELAGLGDRYRFLGRRQPSLPTERAPTETEALFLRYLRRAQRSGTVRRDLDPLWLLELFGVIVAAAAGPAWAQRRGRATMVRRTVEGLLRPPPDG